MTSLVGADGKLTKRIAFETTAAVKDCCAAVLAETKPRMFGMQSRCSICENRFKTVEADVLPTGDATGSFAELFASRSGNVSPVSVKLLRFTKKRFAGRPAVKDWARANGFLFASIEETPDGWVARQAPDSWFAPTSFPRVIRLGDGVLAEIGSRRSEFKEKQAAPKDLTAPERPAAKEEEVPDWVLPDEKGMSPSAKHTVKWAGKYWTLKAAARGFQEKAMHEPPPTGTPADETSPAETPAPKADENSMPVPADGKCPEGWIKRGDVCVRFAKAAPDQAMGGMMTGHPEETMPVPADGKCPEGWSLQGDMCVRVGKK